jgi:FimV-like protein
VVPAFTPDEVARIARNKLDLAVEYIDLGDVVGARTLINEVIESNDADTRADARALLSTLAPLS